MPATHEQIREFLDSPDWTRGEKFIIQWQFGLFGDFRTALMDAIRSADEVNLRLLYRGFPDEVQAFRQWAYGDLGKRLRAAGLGI